MNHYKATNTSDGSIVEYDADVPQAAHLLPPWTCESVSAAFIAPDAPVAPPPPVKITQLAFLNRFTDPEAIAIDLASQGATVPAATLRRYMSKVTAATFIDLNDTDTRAGVLALETATLIATGRSTVILDTPPTDKEMYLG